MPTERSELSYLQAIGRALGDAMAEDRSVIVLGQDVAEYGGAFKLTRGLAAEFGRDRVVNTPIAESGTIGMAVGAALFGLRPVVEMQFADFVTCGFNQVVNVAAKFYFRAQRPVPMVIRLPYGGGVGAGPFHSQSNEAWFLHVPGLKIVAPSTPQDAYDTLRAAIRDPNPVLYFEHKHLYRRLSAAIETSSPADRVIPGARVTRSGRDVSVVSWGLMARRSLEAAERLAAEGIDVELLDLAVLAPLELGAVEASLVKTGKLAIVHEAPAIGGAGAEIAARLGESCFRWLDAPIIRIAFPPTPVPFHPALEERALPSVDRIATEIRRLARA